MNNPMFNMFGGFANFMAQFNQFRQNIQQNGIDPKQQVQQLLNSGRVSPQQYQNAVQMAQQFQQMFTPYGRR